MKFDRWRDEGGRRFFSPNVAIVVGFAAGALAALLGRAVFGSRDAETNVAVFVFTWLVVMVWTGSRPIAEGEKGDRLTAVALYASLATLAALLAYGRLF